MNYPQALVVAALLSYLLGSFPTGYLIGKSKGIDIRTKGSGNIGATNVWRILGPGSGASTFIIDFLKGLIAVRLSIWLAWNSAPYVSDYETIFGLVGGLACILGHNFPVWLKFRGGKGVATTSGVLVALMPFGVLIALMVWVVAFGIWRYVSLASILAAISIPITNAITTFGGALTQREPVSKQDWLFFAFSILIAFLVIWRHRTNIERLRKGTEPRAKAAVKSC